MTVFSPNQTSAKLLINYAEEKYMKEGKDQDIERYLIIYDIFIKARSYFIINKIFFIFAVFSGFVVLLWPSFSIFAKDFGWEKGFLNSAIVQTTVTGIAALTFAIYSHYKKMQLYAENLLRYSILSEDPAKDIKETIFKELERIDGGFNFGKNIIKDKQKL
jgi:hypothetical protein